ncbi:MAG: metallophosphatase, partial [Limosilactobacillus fermentum]
FAPRPYQTVEEMDKVMVEAWNARVKENDTVYHLGDIAVNYQNHQPERVANEQIATLLSQLNGHLVLIKGNHDRRSLFKYLATHNPILGKQAKYEFHDVGKLIKYDHHQLYLTHYPMMMGIAPKIINLHGHIHHYMVPTTTNLNVGVDAPELDYLTPRPPFGTPLSLPEVMEMMAKKVAVVNQSNGMV